MSRTVEFILVLAICALGGFAAMSVASKAIERQNVICQEGC